MKVKSSLVELPDLHFEAQMFITPGRSGSGKASAERSIGVNVAALDFSVATDLLRTLHSWEVIIRSDRKLTPPALVPKEPSIDAEVQATVDFHCSHLEWSLTQEWAVEFASEVYGLHAKGRSAAIICWARNPSCLFSKSFCSRSAFCVEAINLTGKFYRPFLSKAPI